ncbi:MAG: hypothetical protein ACF8MF_06900, partial [Phycisphaerales bacterium JB052]
MKIPSNFDINGPLFIGDWTSKIGKVHDIVSTSCDPDPEIWARAAFYAVPQLLWSLYKPEPLDAYTDLFLRPHKRKRRWNFRPMGRIVANEPWATGINPKVFRLGSLAQRVGWYFLIVDAALDGAVNWTSAAYSWSGCNVPGLPKLVQHSLDTQGIAGGRTRYLQDWVVDRSLVFEGGGRYVIIPPGYNYVISLSISDGPNRYFGPAWYEPFQAIWVENETTGERIDLNFTHYDKSAGGTLLTKPIAGQNFTQRLAVKAINPESGYCQITNGYLTVHGVKDLYQAIQA